jgi:hypothetical protein
MEWHEKRKRLKNSFGKSEHKRRQHNADCFGTFVTFQNFSISTVLLMSDLKASKRHSSLLTDRSSHNFPNLIQLSRIVAQIIPVRGER